VSLKWRVVTLAMATGGGVLGILGAAIQELSQGSLFMAFVAAPMIEEAMKPTGAYIILARWPHLLGNRTYTALLAALGGLVFGVIENIAYLQFGFSEHGQSLLVFRYVACLPLHVICSFVFGFGINEKLLASVRGEIPFLKGNKRFFLAAIILHSLFNITTVLFADSLGV